MILQDLSQEECHPLRVIEVTETAGVFTLSYSRTQEAVCEEVFETVQEAREWIRDSGQFPRVHPALPGRPRSVTPPGAPYSEGQPEVRARVPKAVAQWVAEQGPGWLGKMVIAAYQARE